MDVSKTRITLAITLAAALASGGAMAQSTSGSGSQAGAQQATGQQAGNQNQNQRGTVSGMRGNGTGNAYTHNGNAGGVSGSRINGCMYPTATGNGANRSQSTGSKGTRMTDWNRACPQDPNHPGADRPNPATQGNTGQPEPGSGH